MHLTSARLGLLIATAYLTALFLPAVDWIVVGTKLQPGSASDTLPGWQALLAAVSQVPVIWEASTLGRAVRAALSTLSGLTNIILVLGLVALIWRALVLRGRFGVRLEVALWVAATINTHWFLYLGEEYPVRSALRVGYFVWLGCFVVLALVIRAVRRPTEREAIAPAV